MAVTLFAEETASIRGTISLPKLPPVLPSEKYIGTVSGKILGPPPTLAAVWLEGNFPESRPAPVTPLLMPQRNYQFGQSLLIVPRGSTVVFPNEDDDYHNVFSLSRPKRFDLGRYKKSEKPAPTVTFDKPGVVRLFCEIHEHMRGTIVVVESPYFTLTDERGGFHLRGLPAGNYTLKVWVSEKHHWEHPVSLKQGKALTLELPN